MGIDLVPVALLVWEREVRAARYVPAALDQVVVVDLGDRVDVVGPVRRGPGWPGREVTTYG